MATLSYAPRVRAYIQTTSKDGKNADILDVTEDLVSGSLSIREKALHTFNFELQNTQRKYDGLIRPMDKMTITMQRIGAPCQVFSGYLNAGMIFSVWPRVQNLSATCTLKKLAYFYWDSGAPASAQLLQTWSSNQTSSTTNNEEVKKKKGALAGSSDGGLRDLAISLLTKVAGWPKGNIHIGKIPEDWYAFAQDVGDEILKLADESQLIGDLGGLASSGDSGGLLGNGKLSAGTYGGLTLDQDQAQNAATIYNVAVSMKLDARAAAQGIACSIVESRLKNLHYGDADSQGLFQQRPSAGWGTVAQITDPVYAAKKFFSVLITIPGYKTGDFGLTVQAVQRSAFPDRYAQQEKPAEAIVAALAKGGGDIHNIASSAGSSISSLGSAKPAGASGRNIAAQGYNLILSHAKNPIRYSLGGDDDQATPPEKVKVLDCLTGDTIVHTANRGPVPIRDVAEGDMVWSWDEGHLHPRKVVSWMERGVKQTYKVRSRGRTVRATDNHRLLVVRRSTPKHHKQYGKGGRFAKVDWQPEWVEVKNLVRGDMIVSLDALPDVNEPQALPDGTPITEDVAWLLGQYVGNGSLSNSSVQICTLKEPLQERLADIAAQTWGLDAKFYPTQGVVLNSAHLKRVIADLGLAVGHAKDKVLPDVVKNLPRAEMRAFLQGYAEADGHPNAQRGRKDQSYSSCSRQLLDEVRALHIGLGDRTTNVTTNWRKNPITIKDKRVKNALPLHSFVAYPDAVKRHQTMLNTYGVRRALPDEAFTIEKVLSVEPDAVEETYDLEVEGSHNFLADGLVFHNCSSFVQWCYYHATGQRLQQRTSEMQQAACRIKFGADLAQEIKGCVIWPEPGHIEVSLGNGSTAAAHTDGVPLDKQVTISKAYGMVQGGLLPGVDYTDAATTQRAADFLTKATGKKCTTSNPSEFGTGSLVETGGAGASGNDADSVFNALINVYTWGFAPSADSQVLAGPRALMNDDRILPYITNILQSSMRSWCSAPNGDLMAWFPDYFDTWGIAAKLVVRPIELMDFTVMWDDTDIVTHQYVVGVPPSFSHLDQGSGTVGLSSNGGLAWQLQTSGIATMDSPEIFRTIFGQDATHEFLEEYLNRFGARPNTVTVPTVQQGRPEFFLALFLFMQNWAKQFKARVPTTFMPEAWPGMILQLPEFDLQAYITGVTHSFRFGEGGYFKTDIDVIAPSRISEKEDKMGIFGLLPRGGKKNPVGTSPTSSVLKGK